MKNLLILSIALICLAAGCRARAVTEALTASGEQENSLTDVDQEEVESGETYREWIKMSKKPPSKVHYHPGQTIELECEIVGSPAPIVSWVRGTGQLVNVSFNSISISCKFLLAFNNAIQLSRLKIFSRLVYLIFNAATLHLHKYGINNGLRKIT